MANLSPSPPDPKKRGATWADVPVPAHDLLPTTERPGFEKRFPDIAKLAMLKGRIAEQGEIADIGYLRDKLREIEARRDATRRQLDNTDRYSSDRMDNPAYNPTRWQRAARITTRAGLFGGLVLLSYTIGNWIIEADIFAAIDKKHPAGAFLLTGLLLVAGVLLPITAYATIRSDRHRRWLRWGATLLASLFAVLFVYLMYDKYQTDALRRFVVRDFTGTHPLDLPLTLRAHADFVRGLLLPVMIFGESFSCLAFELNIETLLPPRKITRLRKNDLYAELKAALDEDEAEVEAIRAVLNEREVKAEILKIEHTEMVERSHDWIARFHNDADAQLQSERIVGERAIFRNALRDAQAAAANQVQKGE